MTARNLHCGLLDGCKLQEKQVSDNNSGPFLALAFSRVRDSVLAESVQWMLVLFLNSLLLSQQASKHTEALSQRQSAR